MATDAGEPYPLTEAQRQIWFLQQLHPESGFLNLAMLVQFTTSIRVELLRQAIGQFIEENENIRLCLSKQAHDDYGLPKQYPAAVLPVLPTYDFRGESDPMLAARQWAQETRRQPFDLMESLLFSFALLQISDTCVWLYIRAHHLIADGMSILYASNDIMDLYLLLAQGSKRDFRAKPPYFEVLRREQHYLQSERYAQDRRFWQEQFDAPPEPVSLAPAWASAQMRECDVFPYVIEADVKRRIDTFCRDYGISPFQFFFTAFQTFLCRMTGRQEMTLTQVTGNRTHPDDKTAFGLFVNTLVFRFETEPSASFAEHCQRMARKQTRLLRHQKYPFSHLLTQLRERLIPTDGLFPIGIEYQKLQFVQTSELVYQVETFTAEHAKEELLLHIKDRSDLQAYRLEWKYQRGVFSAADMELWAERFVRYLAQALDFPDRPVADLELLSAEERHRLLVEYNATEHAGFASVSSWVELFSAQAASTPDATALEFGAQRVTYGELASRTEALAHRLRREGIGPEDIVALLLPRSIALIEVILAVGRAGGAYLPIDPDYPADRIAYMLDDSKARFLIAVDGFEGIPALPDCRVLAWDSLKEAGEETAGVIDGCEDDTSQGINSPAIDLSDRSPFFVTPDGSSADLLDRQAAVQGQDSTEGGEALVRSAAGVPTGELGLPSGEGLAYVIYTSGSTGNPKGVMIEHRGLANLALDSRERFGIGVGTRGLQFASASFDASVYELFGILCSGGTLVLESRPALLPGPPLIGVLQDKRIGFAVLPPSVLAMMSETGGGPAALPELTTIVSAGEACPPEVAAAWSAGRRFFNGYGPTEVTVCATVHAFDGRKAMPIGVPIANKRLFVLDGQGKPVPPGVAGELWIGGIGLARGYLRRPELTAEKFVRVHPGPPYSAPLRLYRSGDWVKFGPDGALHYFGRIDGQIKIRGHRVELGEIEYTLGLHPAVRQAAAATSPDGQGGLRLNVFALTGKPRPTPLELRSYLEERLPAHMAPHRIYVIDELPLTPSGKVDRATLLAKAEIAASAPMDVSAVGEHPLERRLAQIWAETLGVRQVGVTDRFFELGGDSFQLLRLHRRLADELYSELSVMDLFLHPTVRSLAARLLAGRGAAEVAAAAQPQTPRGQRASELARQKKLRMRTGGSE